MCVRACVCACVCVCVQVAVYRVKKGLSLWREKEVKSS